MAKKAVKKPAKKSDMMMTEAEMAKMMAKKMPKKMPKRKGK